MFFFLLCVCVLLKSGYINISINNNVTDVLLHYCPKPEKAMQAQCSVKTTVKRFSQHNLVVWAKHLWTVLQGCVCPILWKAHAYSSCPHCGSSSWPSAPQPPLWCDKRLFLLPPHNHLLGSGWSVAGFAAPHCPPISQPLATTLA